jgi:hypothetical protein
MSTALFLIFNHRFTQLQATDAQMSLGVERIVELPPDLQATWSNLPADEPELTPSLAPLCAWLTSNAARGDFVLIQGDFGACYLMVSFAFDRGLIPIYSTTERRALEDLLPDGTVKLVHNFRHVMFRRYGR